VAVTGGDAAPVVDFNQIAVATRVPAGAKHGAIGSGVNRGPVRAGEIDAGVHCGAGMERVGADTESAGELDVHFHGLVRRDCDHAVLKLVELLPAVEQRLEGRVAGTLERSADATVAADARRGDAELLQLGRRDLVAGVERLSDERGLLQLRLLDASKRARGGNRTGFSCGL